MAGLNSLAFVTHVTDRRRATCGHRTSGPGGDIALDQRVAAHVESRPGCRYQHLIAGFGRVIIATGAGQWIR